MRGGLLRGHEVALGTHHALERRHHLLADGIDRRVGHLREHLLEVLVGELGNLGHHREGRVVAHRTQRLGPGANHGEQDHVERLAREPGGAQGREETDDAIGVVAGAADGRLGHRAGIRDEVVEFNHLVLYPVGVRALGGDLRLHVRVLQDGALIEVHEKDVSRSEPALLLDFFRRDVHDANLGRHDDAAGFGEVEPPGPEAVAIEGGPDLHAVGEGDEGGAVPRFHHRGVKLVEGASRGVHVRVVLPSLGDHEHHSLGQAPAAALDEQLEDRVEGAGIREAALDGGRELGLKRIGDAELLGDVDETLARQHPVGVALQGVDLAVVPHHVQRLRAVPARERVRGEAAVHQG